MQLESPNILVTLFAFIILIGTLVVIHELGHYWVGRWFGVKAEKFSIGVGPQLWGRTDKRGTLWRVGALPLGGYVQFAGDMNPASQPDENWEKLSAVEQNQTFQSKSLWQRTLIVFAGPAINFIFAVMIFMGFLLSFGQPYTPPIVVELAEKGAAAEAGLQKGDRIMSFDGDAVESFEQLVNEVIIIPGQKVRIVVERSGQRLEKQVLIRDELEVDRFGNEYRVGKVGLAWPQREMRDISIVESPWAAVKLTGAILKQQMQAIGQIISGRRSVKELGGPLKIAKISGEQLVSGVVAFIWFAAIISINLGFINLLPIPMLDGGHLLLYLVEAVRRRPATPMVQEWAFRAGFIMLVGFMLMVTFNDLASFGLFGGPP